MVSDPALSIGETSLVTITFSEAVTGFTNADLTVANGTLSAVSSSDGGITWTATFTPTTGISDTTNLITLDNSGVADLAGNGGTGTTDSNNYSIDTQRPTATVVVSDPALSIGETSLVTITFSEAVTGFTNADLTVANGTLSAVSSSDGGITWTATFTPTTGISDTTNLITLDNSGVTDLAGNGGNGTTDSNNFSIDTQLPTATIALSQTALNAGQTATVTITFSEAVTGFDLSDLRVSNGTLSGLTTTDNITWTAIFTPETGVTVSANSIVLDNSGIADLAGNYGEGSTQSAGFSIDSELPRVTGLTPLPATSAQTVDYQLDFSEAVSGVDASDFTLLTAGKATGTIASITMVSPTRYVIHLAGISGDGAVQLTLNASGTGITDSAGNAISGGFNGEVYETPETSPGTGTTPPPVITPPGPTPPEPTPPVITPPQPTPPDATLPSRGYDSQPLAADAPVRTGGQSQITLLTLPATGASLPGAMGERTPTFTQIFRTSERSGAVGASALAAVFGNNGVTGYETGVVRTQPADLGQPHEGTTLFASVFGAPPLPGVNALEVFSGSSWQPVTEGSIAPLVAPATVFGAPVFSMQLQQLNDDEATQLASLEGAIQNVKPSV